jgi:hypothetical protein
MKSFSSTILLATTFALPIGLNACSSAPVQIPLDPLEFTAPAIVPTLGTVIFVAKPAKFQSLPGSFSTVSITGNAAATNIDPEVQADMYASSGDPASIAGCLAAGEVVICLNAAGPTKITTNPVILKKDGNKTAFKLEDQNGVLKTAVTSGKFWIGLKVVSGAGLQSKVTFSDMVASLAVF